MEREIFTISDPIDEACHNYMIVRNSNVPKFIKLDNWLNKEAKIFNMEISKTLNEYPKYKKGQIVKVDFGVNIGSELSYTHFAIVINGNDTKYYDSLTIIPISSKNGNYRIPLGKILKQVIPNTKRYNLNCYAIVNQIKTISKKRIYQKNYNYVCNQGILQKIDFSLLGYLAIDNNLNI